MANINSLQMGKSICSDGRISIRKSWLGLRTIATYRITNSVVDARKIDYSPEDGKALKRILCLSRELQSEFWKNFHPKPIVDGNYLLEVCLSRDKAFLALQLLQYMQLGYEPVTDVLIYEGEEARMASQFL